MNGAEPGPIHPELEPLRGYVDREVRHLREFLEQRLGALDETLRVRDGVIDEHLGALNNAHEKARMTAADTDAKAEKIANLTLTKDKFEEFRLATDAKAKAHETDMAAARNAQTVASRAVVISVIGWVIIVGGWVVQYFLRRP